MHPNRSQEDASRSEGNLRWGDDTGVFCNVLSLDERGVRMLRPVDTGSTCKKRVGRGRKEEPEPQQPTGGRFVPCRHRCLAKTPYADRVPSSVRNWKFQVHHGVARSRVTSTD